MGIDAVGRVQQQLTVDLAGLDESQQVRLRDGVEGLLRQIIAGEEYEVAGWTTSTLENAFARLESAGAHVQATVIREALKNNGYLTRERVYRIGSYSKDRTLRGFTRPVNRIVADMKAEELIPGSAADLLTSSFQNGVVADGFSVDARLNALLQH